MSRKNEAVTALIIGLPAFFTLLWLDWKVALCVMCMIWANNFNTVMKNEIF